MSPAPAPKVITKIAKLLDDIFTTSEEKKDDVEVTKEPSTQDESMDLKDFKETSEFLDLEETTKPKAKESSKIMLVAPGSIIPSHLKEAKTPEQVAKEKKMVEAIKAHLENLGKARKD